MQALCQNTKTHKCIEWEIIYIALGYWSSCLVNSLATGRSGSKFQKYLFTLRLKEREKKKYQALKSSRDQFTNMHEIKTIGQHYVYI